MAGRGWHGLPPAAGCLRVGLRPLHAGQNNPGRPRAQRQTTDTVPSLPGVPIVISPAQVHWHVHPVCNAGSPLIVTLLAPGVHGVSVAGVHGAGVRTPIAAAVAAATSGLARDPHIPNDGMFSIGTKSWIVPAGVSQLTGLPLGTTVSGTCTGGIACEQEISAVLETSCGIGRTVRLLRRAGPVLSGAPPRSGPLRSNPVRPRLGFLSLLAAALLAVAIATAGTAAASSPRGRLTQHEFTLLSAAQLGLGQVFGLGSSKRALAQAEDQCMGVTFGVSTPLLVSERASCLRQLTLTLLLESYRKTSDRCQGRPSEAAKLRCAVPIDKRLAGAARATYAVDAKVMRVSERRGFVGRCLAALAFTQAQLADQHKLARASRTLLTSIPHVLSGLRGSDLMAGLSKVRRIDNEEEAVQALASKVLEVRSPAITACPQQRP